MKHLLIILVAFLATLLSVETKIPDYIKVCKPNDAKISECIKSSVEELRGKLIVGIPELEVPKLEPMFFAKMVLPLGPGLQTELRDLEVHGLGQFELLEVEIMNFTYVIKLTIAKLDIRGSYEMDIKLGGIPLKGKGPLYFSPKSINAEAVLYGKPVTRSGEKLLQFRSVRLTLKIPDYELRLENLFGGDSVIGKATNMLLNDQKTEVMAAMIPGLEGAIAQRVLAVANNICKHFTYDELFPTDL